MKKLKILKRSFFIIFFIVVFAMVTNMVFAAPLTSVNDTLEDSRPSVDSNHEIQFVTPSGVGTSETITLTFDDTGDAFDLTSVGFADIDLAEDTDATPGDCSGTLTDKTLAGTASATDWGVDVNTTTDVITFTAPSSGTPVNSNACVIIEIGDNASGGTNKINNPSSEGSYDIDIAGTFGDTGTVVVAITNTITAQVQVQESLTFTVGGIADTSCTDRPNQGSEITTTATSIDFGTATFNSFIDGCQSLTITTNAANGYSVTVLETDELTSGSDQIADGSCDGGCTITTDAAWATSTNNGFGYCLEDQVGTDVVDFSGEQCDDTTPQFKIFGELGTDTPESIMSNGSSVEGNQIHVGYRLSVPGTQVAGTYTNNIIFVATPNY